MCRDGERLPRVELTAECLEMAGLRLSWVMHFFLGMCKVFPVLESAEFKPTLKCRSLEKNSLVPAWE